MSIASFVKLDDSEIDDASTRRGGTVSPAPAREVRAEPGERFAVAGRRDLLVVRACHLAATDEITGRTFYVVTAEAGSRWSLVRVERDDGVKWLGTPLPADPTAPER